MSNAYLSPILNDAQFNDDGTFLAGGLIWFYVAGTSTPIVAYTDPTAVTAWANPIVLDARGETGGELWLLSGSTYKMVVESPPEYGNTHGPLVSTFDNISGVNDPGTNSVQNWVAFGGTPTYVSTTTFTVSGDQRGIFLSSRRLKTTNTGGTVYSTVVTTTYATGQTTVTVSNDYGEALDSGLSAISYGFIETGPVSSIPIPVNAGSAAHGSQYQMWIDYDGANLKWSANSNASSATWPIIANTAIAAATNSFSTQQTSSQGIINVRSLGANDVSLEVDSTGWGLLQQTVGYGIQYTTATGKYAYGGFTLPTQSGISGYSVLPNGMIMQWGYATSSNAGATITFPVSFTNASSYAITVGNQGSASTTHYPIVVNNYSASQFKAYQAAGDTFYFIAMGF